MALGSLCRDMKVVASRDVQESRRWMKLGANLPRIHCQGGQSEASTTEYMSTTKRLLYETTFLHAPILEMRIV